MVIPRRLGEVLEPEIRQCVGLYKIIIVGGGGGGGGYDTFYEKYGSSGRPGGLTASVATVRNGIVVTPGSGGAKGIDNSSGGTAGSSGGVTATETLSATGGAGGAAGGSGGYTSGLQASYYLKKTRLDATAFLDAAPDRTQVLIGSGGASSQNGVNGGLIIAIRIG